jgi:hypothetical protein
VKKALALLAYARLDYLEPVWTSIQSQTIAGRSLRDTYDVYVFHDGLWTREPADVGSGHQAVRDWLDRLPSWTKVTKQAENLGIARHYDFVEKQLFVESGYDFVVFCEDDLMLAPGYLSAIDRMADRFHADRRVGMIAAHPCDPTVSIEQQRVHKAAWAPMGHSWGYGMSRSFWERRQPLIEHYLDLLGGRPYRQRDHRLIMTWLERIGFRPAATSQDYVKTCATYALGAVKLSTFANLGRPIGRAGVHCTPEMFERMGLDRAVVFDGEIDVVADLSDEIYRDLWRQMIHQVGELRVPVIADPDAHDVQIWETRLAAGEFHANRVVADLIGASASPAARRLMPCPCGSGKRLKHCHGRLS